LPQIGLQPLAIVGERGHADAALGRGNQGPAERVLDRDKADRLAGTTAPPRAGGHAQPCRSRVIGARARAEPRRIDRLGDRLTGLEPVGQTAEPVGARVVAWRRAGDLLENPVEMKGADPRGIGELGEGRDGVAVPQ